MARWLSELTRAGMFATDADLKAFQTLLGEQAFQEKFGKSETHSCGSHAKCGASSKIINWSPTTAAGSPRTITSPAARR